MRQKRAKAYRKLMALYSNTFGFRQPYQVLVDSEMCKSATDLRIELVKQLGSVLQGDVKPMITQCCIHELYLQGKAQQSAVDLAKNFERRKCNHREPIPGDECVFGVVGDTNKHRYVIATQSQPLRSRLRSIPAVPLVHINRAVIVLEPPSDATLRVKMSSEEKALYPAASDFALISTSSLVEPIHKKRKGAKAPNPLSIKKKIMGEDKETRGERQFHVQAQSRDSVRVGEKRKREDNHMTTDYPLLGVGDIKNKTPLKKRRRRKKVANISTDL
ncbi:Fcf1-domain-containing protein [Collybia nuda]|uniref:U three protein 23 n=1 Tax=Collybia nuda TaxID=64659 RepID=A0A9P5XWR0_9AGAR|nr:Fcf1-domain-containing protein [Collybia nuda]